MAKTVRHYRDKRTGLYVTKRRWLNAKKRGDKNLVRVQERYTKPTKQAPPPGKKLPPPVGPIAPGPGVERLKYLQAEKGKHVELEIKSENGKLVSVQVGRRIYTAREDFRKLADLVEAARIEGTKVAIPAHTRPRTSS